MPAQVPTASVILIVLQLVAIINSLYMNVFDFSAISNNNFIYLFYIIFIHSSVLRALYHSAVVDTRPQSKDEEAQSINCRQCKQKVYIRDHHCVYIGQCIGKYNFKHFFSYLFFVYLITANNLSRTVFFWNKVEGSMLEFLSGMDWNFKGRLIYFIISGLFGIFFTGHLLAYQLYMILNEMTNFEHSKKIKEVKIGPWVFTKSLFTSSGRKMMKEQFKRRWNLYFSGPLDFVLFDS